MDVTIYHNPDCGTSRNTLADLFQGIAERNLPIGKDDLFVLPTRQRHLHSVRSASIQYSMMEDRIYQLVVEAGLAQTSELSSGRIYFDANKGHELLTAALDTVTSAEMASAMGVTIDRVRAILDANLIVRVETSAENTRIYSRVRREDFEHFRDTINTRAARTEERGHLVDFGRAARPACCKVEKIIELALEGKLSSLRRIHDDGLISGLVVDAAEVRLQVTGKRRNAASEAHITTYDAGAANPDLLNRRQAERRLKTASGTVRELVHLGLLKTVEAMNPVTQRCQDYICARSLEAFDNAHVSLAMLADRANIFPGSLRTTLNERGISAIFEPTGRNSRYYRMTDVGTFTG